MKTKAIAMADDTLKEKIRIMMITDAKAIEFTSKVANLAKCYDNGTVLAGSALLLGGMILAFPEEMRPDLLRAVAELLIKGVMDK